VGRVDIIVLYPIIGLKIIAGNGKNFQKILRANLASAQRKTKFFFPD